jgi:hypothetical protein
MQYRFSAPGLALALAGALLCAPSLAAADSVTLTTDFGRVSLEVEPDGKVWGDYPNYQGELVGALTPQGGLDMVWIQPKSEMRCDSERYGSRFWGIVRWKISGDAVKGLWNYCDAPLRSGHPWNGTILAGAEAFALAAPQAVSDMDVERAVRFEWGQHASGSGDFRTVKADINCDGAADRVVYRMDHDNPDGPFFTVMGLAYAKGELLSDSLSFGVNSDTELSVCAMDGAPGPEVSADQRFESDEVVTMTGYNGLCGRAVRVDDGMCDSTWLFWSDEMITEGHFVTFRN